MKEVEQDPYCCLKPEGLAPAEEVCGCIGKEPVVIVGGIGPNPIACSICNKGILPEVIGMDEEMAREIAAWRSFHECFWYLWLDSQEYEDWAAKILSDPSSPVNVRGIAAAEKLSLVRPAFLWWFQDYYEEDWEPLDKCPVCGEGLVPLGHAVACTKCRVFLGDRN